MSFSHEAIAAWPTPGTGNPDRGLIRAMTTRRFAYCLAADEAASDFVAKDPVSGIAPLYLIQNSILFAYDETDSSTLGDGVTCLVTNDACRYKSDTIAPPWSVKDKDLTAQPVSPADGDRYLIPTAATGTDWAGKDGKVGIYKGTRWHFAVVPIGRLLYVEDETAFYHRNTSGVWTAGIGSISIGANSVPMTAVIGAKASFVIKVENQTTNAPPSSPVAPTAYIIGPSPTGTWAGNAGKLAICLTNGAFTIIAPTAGDTVYDKAQKVAYEYTGTAWASARGRWIDGTYVFTAASGGSTTGSGGYTWSASTPPTTTQGHVTDPATITWTARKANAVLRVRYQASVTANTTDNFTFGLLRDSDSNALAWDRFYTPTTFGVCASMEFYIQATDTNQHVYKMAVWFGANTPSAVSRRLFTLDEAA